MPSPADRFTQMQKIAVFLITIGEERTREVLVDLDFDTLEEINHAISSLGELTPQEKASVMIEFGDLFFKDIPLKSKLEAPTPPPPPKIHSDRAAPSRRDETPPLAPRPGVDTGRPAPRPRKDTGSENRPPAQNARTRAQDEGAADQALRHLKQHVDPGKIDWGRAGYDFGEGFRGRTDDRDR